MSKGTQKRTKKHGQNSLCIAFSLKVLCVENIVYCHYTDKPSVMNSKRFALRICHTPHAFRVCHGLVNTLFYLTVFFKPMYLDNLRTFIKALIEWKIPFQDTFEYILTEFSAYIVDRSLFSCPFATRVSKHLRLEYFTCDVRYVSGAETTYWKRFQSRGSGRGVQRF